MLVHTLLCLKCKCKHVAYFLIRRDTFRTVCKISVRMSRACVCVHQCTSMAIANIKSIITLRSLTYLGVPIRQNYFRSHATSQADYMVKVSSCYKKRIYSNRHPLNHWSTIIVLEFFNALSLTQQPQLFFDYLNHWNTRVNQERKLTQVVIGY